MATKILIAINVLVMVLLAVKNPAMLLVPDKQSLIECGANFGLLSCTGEQWRLFSYMWLHVGILHLAVNMWALYKVGPPAEDLFGWREMIAIYVFSGIMGSLASCLYNPRLVSSGASGAIFGVYGSLLAFMYVQRERYPRNVVRQYAIIAAIFLACNMVYGMMMPDIDSFAHFGGLSAGGFSGFLFAQLQVKEKYRNAFTFPMLILLVGATFAVTHVCFDRRGYQYYAAGIKALKRNDFKTAAEQFTEFIALHPGDADAYGSRGTAYLKLGELNRCAADFTRVTRLAPESAGPYNDLAWAECGLKEYEEAVEHASAAIRRSPKMSAAYDTRGYAYAHLGKWTEAQADFAEAIKIKPNDPAPHYHWQRTPPSAMQTASVQLDPHRAKKYEKETWED